MSKSVYFQNRNVIVWSYRLEFSRQCLLYDASVSKEFLFEKVILLYVRSISFLLPINRIYCRVIVPIVFKFIEKTLKEGYRLKLPVCSTQLINLCTWRFKRLYRDLYKRELTFTHFRCRWKFDDFYWFLNLKKSSFAGARKWENLTYQISVGLMFYWTTRYSLKAT